MTDYVCPDEIVELYDASPKVGRERAVEWATSLDLKIGDRVWLPEVGWQMKTRPMVQ